MSKGKTAALCLLLALAAGLAGAEEEPAGGETAAPPVICLVTLAEDTPARSAVLAGAQRSADELGFTLLHVDTDAEHAPEAVAAAARQAQALIVTGAHTPGMAAPLEAAQQAGLPVVGWGPGTVMDAHDAVFSPGSPYAMGKALADMLARSLKERGRDPKAEAIRYCWHGGYAGDGEREAWRREGKAYISDRYPNWIDVTPADACSGGDTAAAARLGGALLALPGGIDGVLCMEEHALEGQLEAMRQAGLTAGDVCVVGWAPPARIRPYLREGLLTRWGYWDAGREAKAACLLAVDLVRGRDLRFGEVITDGSGWEMEAQPNSVLDERADDSRGVLLLLPERMTFTAENADEYDF